MALILRIDSPFFPFFPV